MKPNIIFVLLDGARWDRLGKSKEFLELQKRGTLLNKVITAIPYTFGSMNVIFTGLYGKENGVDAYYKMFKLKDSVGFLPEILKKNGYFTCCNLISDKVISSRGFDDYQAHDEYKDDLRDDHPKLIKQAFENSDGKPIFCFLQFSRIHTVTVSEILKKYEWDNKKFYEQKDQNLATYDSAFLEAGEYAMKIYQTIENMNKLNETIVIFFADHGTGVGERYGERNYGVFTFEETIRTFYLFIGPGIESNKISEKLASTIDLFPTMLGLTGSKIPAKLSGNNFGEFLLGKSELPERDYVFSETGGLQGPFPSPKAPNVFSIRSPKYKLIYFKTSEEWKLFDLENDPLETIDLYSKGISEEKILKEKLLSWISRDS
jgi:arylsulfatase A-like enzyme